MTLAKVILPGFRAPIERTARWVEESGGQLRIETNCAALRFFNELRESPRVGAQSSTIISNPGDKRTYSVVSQDPFDRSMFIYRATLNRL